MLIRCPECQLEREINLDVIPSGAVLATCPRCKKKFRFRDAVVDAESPPTSDAGHAPQDSTKNIEEDDNEFAEPVRLAPPPSSSKNSEAAASKLQEADSRRAESASQRAETTRPDSTENASQDAAWLDVPWERPDRYGHLMGLYQTIVRVLFNAPKFFSSLPRCRGSIMRPLLFYVLLGLFQVVIKLLWFRSIDPSMTDPQVQELLSSADMSLAMTFIVSPGILAMQLFLYAALFFLMLRLVQPEAVTFPVVLRVVAYSAAPLVVCAVPVIGPMVAMVWFAISCFMGCRFALNLPWHKVALALVPLYLIGFAITMQFVQHLLSQS